MSNKHAVKEAPASYQRKLGPLGSLDAQSRHSREGGNPLAITENLNLWISATKAKSTSGRGSNKKIELVGIKKLRELILELAVRGKLVPQNPEDEPASELLKKIDAEKAKLIAEGKIKKQKKLPEISEDEKPFKLPSKWTWVRLGNIGIWGAGTTPARGNSSYYGGNIPWFKSGELSDDFISSSEETVTDLALSECSLRLNNIGDVLIAMYGATIGKTSILKVRGTTNQAVCACTPYSSVSNLYLLTLLKASKRRFVGMGAGGAQPNISREKIIATSIALPPLAEQHRIVAKVDELMALCDQLEQHSEHQLDAHKQLVETLLATLVESENADELATNWERLAQHFDTLFSGALTSTTGTGNGGGEWAIDRLKDTILQLAVMGKLVPQNPDDEPASELLKKIETEKAKLVKEGKIKKQKPLPEITDEEKPFELPDGWEWVKLQKLVTILGDGLHGTPTYDTRGEYFFVNGNNISDGKIDIKPETKRVLKSEYIKHKKPLNSQTVLVSINGTLGNVGFFNDEPVMLGKSACFFNLCEPLSKLFIKRLIESPYFNEYAVTCSSGTTIKNLGLKAMNELLIPLPPLAEQHRIVAKVDELFTLCDQLKALLQAASETQLTLTEALVEQALR